MAFAQECQGENDDAHFQSSLLTERKPDWNTDSLTGAAAGVRSSDLTAVSVTSSGLITASVTLIEESTRSVAALTGLGLGYFLGRPRRRLATQGT